MCVYACVCDRIDTTCAYDRDKKGQHQHKVNHYILGLGFCLRVEGLG